MAIARAGNTYGQEIGGSVKDRAMYERSTRALAERLGWPDRAVDEAFAFEERHPGYQAWWSEGWCVYIGEGSSKQEFSAPTLDELNPVIAADEIARMEAHEAHMAEIRKMYKNYNLRLVSFPMIFRHREYPYHQGG